MHYLLDWLDAFWGILIEAGVWLLAGFVAAGLIHALVPRRWLERQLGGRGPLSIVKASILGAPIPLCSCSVIPMAAGLRRGGASRGSSASFAIASPEIDAPAFTLTWALIGPAMAIARPIVALATAIAAGLGIEATEGRFRGRGTAVEPAAGTSGCASSSAPAPGGKSCCSAAPAPASCCSSATAPAIACCEAEATAAGGGSCCAPAGRDERTPWWRDALRFTFVTLPADLAGWMTLGLALSALVVVLIPPGWIDQHLQSGTLGPIAAKLLALVVGIPLYVCATASTPLVAALMAAGLSPGAGLVFLLAGPATNPATMAWVVRDLGWRSLVVYLLAIAGMALGAGFAVDLLLPAGWFVLGDALHHHEHVAWWDQAAAVVLALLLGGGLLRSFLPRLQRSGGDAALASANA